MSEWYRRLESALISCTARKRARSLTLHRRIMRGRPVADGEPRETLEHLAGLRGFRASLERIGADDRAEYCQESRD
jgi:hypothetical protein